jgi:hypothetical protein
MIPIRTPKARTVPGGVDIALVSVNVSPYVGRIIRDVVIAGLDPAIHHLLKMDARIKSAHDGLCATRKPDAPSSRQMSRPSTS